MKKIYTVFYTLLWCMVFLTGNLAAQDMDKQLADQYVKNGEYEKAVFLFEKLYERDQFQPNHFESLLQCYVVLKQYNDAVKLTQKHAKKFNKQPWYKIDHGYALELVKDSSKANKEFEAAIKDMRPDEGIIRTVAEAFNQYGKLNWMIKTYQQGNDLLKDDKYFLIEIARLYASMLDHKNAIQAYLTYLESDPSRLQEMKNSFHPLLENKSFLKELNNQVYAKLQKNPDGEIWNDLAIWLAIQQKDFEDALVQAKAIDKKKNENGRRVIEIARLARAEKDFNAAINGFEYIVAKGKESPLYFIGQNDLLSTRKEKIQESPTWTKEDALKLKHDYQMFFADNGRNSNTAPAIIEYAEVLAKYVYDLDSAIIELENLIQMPLAQSTRSRAKLLLGDFYVMINEVWEAMLVYGQVDKEEKDSPFGEEARFKHARLFYFKGEFELSKELLNVLKTATSELIANDALNLSVFIIDNLGTDSVSLAMEQFAAAELLFLQNKDDQALATLDSIYTNFKGHALTDDIYFVRAKIFIKKRQYEKAIDQLQSLITNFKSDILGDDATFMLAQVYDEMLHDPANAQKYYKELLTNYRESVFVVEARKRYRKLRGDKLDEEL